jgi:hypothetical protein
VDPTAVARRACPSTGSDEMHSVDLRSFGLLRDFRWYCKPKRVCKIGDSGKPPAASAAGEISGHCLSNLVICRRQYGTDALLFDVVVHGRAGDISAAEPLLREMLSIPAPRRAKGVWCDPLFAPLRTDARFRSLMQELGADTSIDPTRRETWPKPSTHE